MRFVIFLAAALSLAACSKPGASLSPVEEVIAAERAFASQARETGWVEAFEAYAAPDAILLQAGPTNALEAMAGIDPANRGDTSLGWSPSLAGASDSGELGFTTGPYNGDGTAFGQYFTVWKRQPDGSWKWIYDGGINQIEPQTLDPEGEVITILPGAESTDPAVDVAAAEAALAAAAAANPGEAFAGVLASQGRVNRDNTAPATGPEAARELLAAGPASLAYAPPLRTETTYDLAFTLGEVRWEGGFGYYGRIWVLEDDGWKLAFDQIVERTPEAPQAAD